MTVEMGQTARALRLHRRRSRDGDPEFAHLNWIWEQVDYGNVIAATIHDVPDVARE